MVAREIIRVNGSVFKSQDELRKFVRKSFFEGGERKIDELHKDFVFLHDLFFRRTAHKVHGNKKIECFFIQKNTYTARIEEMSVKYIDNNNYSTFSWKKCVTNREDTDLAKLKRACRLAIENDIIEFSRYLKQCEFKCNECDCKNGLEIDHVVPFKDIFNSFMREIGNKFEIPTEFILHEFSEIDAEFENAFVVYHLENALLQGLCKKCHDVKTRDDF